MDTREMIQSTVGFTGKWETEHRFRIDPLTYGYLTPLEKIEIEFGGLVITSSPLTNIEWWHHLMPAMGLPPHVKVEPDEVEDGFVELSAGRLKLLEDAEFIEHHFTRLYTYLSRAMSMIEKTNSVLSMGIGVDYSGTLIKLQSRVVTDQDLFVRNCEAFKKLYSKITDIHGKVDTSILPQPSDFNGQDIEDIIRESKFYAMKEAVRLESLDILSYIMSKKGGQIEGNEYQLPKDRMIYKVFPNRVESHRAGNYMGQIGFDKGIKQMQQFFATTLGGGRW
ncbi:hypothetical protein COW36_22805 [bacterium (Candidatus Blackallbacteria) CG17_big_fil_post_rev_8_21_14_2_50_48_46]|uniref:Uncharacterized protein n=1 Tax=bacterium (Candidatus Blackallbacteria) CG17_big_fil_post_rev_8_21_14_2_50_48_46 TaxID=2014261 RepID=A0A2M7FZE6_9BACT|nr:MAG: hypothetical protein COW64_07575 [bacterium (Candidatus Blackallbacteria) CG18_big_fil_WC_8_21_14_2_50_49_26]PIW14210.1 MAG: hypothetical protein COW36_22805 [bacterium (Candidatus Blackallbacteria) CG17_big_fil_post_rev_8_21_14_2_50_48_46]PIW46751.1 MAG: hypothetical protein COW20_15080 [bacterium (Candidatus Blackallbacteria) CG13_big_fil_rev_8_21_14_2_50_49_14]